MAIVPIILAVAVGRGLVGLVLVVVIVVLLYGAFKRSRR